MAGEEGGKRRGRFAEQANADSAVADLDSEGIDSPT